MALAHEHALTDALLIIPGVMLRQQVTRLDIQNPALCLKLFKANREVGLAIAAVLLAGRI